jgi:hypothetical protein
MNNGGNFTRSFETVGLLGGVHAQSPGFFGGLKNG